MFMKNERWIIVYLLASLAAAGVSISPTLAMLIQTSENQLILSGPVVVGDTDRIQRSLFESPAITTVVLRNSPGGDAPTGYRVGEMFRAKNLRTAVSGYCYSSCSRMFLGGKDRVFTDDYPPEFTNVGFHGHYDNSGRLDAELVRRHGLKDWIVKYSDGKADPALVERWTNIPVGRGMIHFYHPTLLRDRGATTFICQGNEPTNSVFACEAEARTALDLGIITSLDTISSNDQSVLRATFPPPRPAPSGFATIEDLAKVPLVSDAGLQNYRGYLSADSPKAFAISPSGEYWAWNAGIFEAVPLALSRCAERARQTCALYAVDDDVVWRPARR
jgi:hypothetical protein